MKESLLTDLFLHAGFFLGLSALVIPLLRYFKIPIALGYLFAGIALGPYAVGAFSDYHPILDFISLNDSNHVKIFAELGIVLLLFVIGLKMTPYRLWQMRSLVFGLGGAQVIVTATIIGGIAYLWGNNVSVSILLGLSLALSSTAIVIQWLHEQKLFVTQVGRSSFSVLLFQDLAVIPILLMLTIMSTDTDGNLLGFVSVSLFKMVATVLLIYVVGKQILKPVFLFADKYGGAESFLALSFLIIVVCASIAAAAGLSMALGAFVAGVLLADTAFRHEIAALITPFKSLFIGMFFLSFGMGINLSFIVEKPLWLMASVIGLMTIKAFIIFALCKLWRLKTAVSVENAILLSQAGEFGLLVVGSALAVGIMEQDVGQFMLITVSMTMLLAPILAPIARRLGRDIESKSHKNKHYEAQQSEDKTQHIVIFGHGRVGEQVRRTLCREGYDTLGFDKNIENVDKARAQSAPIYLGDVSKQSTLKAANLEDALCVVVTLDDVAVTKNIIQGIREINPSVPVVIRAHNKEDEDIFNDFENVDAVAENILLSENLSKKVLFNCEN